MYGEYKSDTLGRNCGVNKNYNYTAKKCNQIRACFSVLFFICYSCNLYFVNRTFCYLHAIFRLDLRILLLLINNM